MSELSARILNIAEELSKISEQIITFEGKVNNSSGIICQKCGSSNSKIINTRDSLERFRVRRRECLDCRSRWNTEEIITDKGCS